MRVLVCGSRNLQPRHGEVMARVLRRFPADTVLIHGNADGADKLAEACRPCAEVRRFQAEWKRHGRAAGPLRNRRMLLEGRPDVVVAFHTDPSLGLGTRDMVEQARSAGVPYEVHLLVGTPWEDGAPVTVHVLPAEAP